MANLMDSAILNTSVGTRVVTLDMLRRLIKCCIIFIIIIINNNNS